MSKLALVLKRISIVFALCLGFTAGFAQPPQNPAGDPDDVPITGIEVLIGLGGLLGIKKISDLKKKR